MEDFPRPFCDSGTSAHIPGRGHAMDGQVKLRISLLAGRVVNLQHASTSVRLGQLR